MKRYLAALLLLTVLFLTACGGQGAGENSSSASGSSYASESTGNESMGESSISSAPASGSTAASSSKSTSSRVPASSSAAQSSEPEKPTAENSFTLSVSCVRALESGLLKESVRKLLPENGQLYPAKKIVFNEGDNALSAMMTELKKNRIPVASTGSYIQSIGGLAEKVCGELSGWMCKVNGEFLNKSLANYVLCPGDVVEWVYTCDLGRDL